MADSDSDQKSIFDLDWSNPDYGPIYEFRAEALDRIRENPKAIGRLKEYYATHWVDFINDWGMTFDPRKHEQKYTPLILFPKQAEYVNWVYDLFKSGRRGLAEKSRDVGFTWLSVAISVCVYLFYPQAVVGFGSRKEPLVDNGDNDPDSIFWKIRTFIDYLPIEFLPSNPLKGRKAMLVPNSDNNAVIKGEIGDEIGRGGRASLYFADEFAHLMHQEMADSALSANTDCRIFLSTVNGAGNLFYQLRHFLPNDQIFIFDWTDDPRKRLRPDHPAEEEAWYIKQKKELLATVFASQVGRNYHSSSPNTFMDGELLLEATQRGSGSIDQPNDVPWRIGVDASGMGNDETIIWARKGRISLEPEAYSKLDGIQLASIIERKAKTLLKLGSIELIGIERDGPGGSAADQLKYGPFASITVAVHTGAKLKDGKNYNLRAFLHQQAYDYVTDTECSLPNDPAFIAQATAIQSLYKGGLLLIESKADYRARFATGKTKAKKAAAKSPDRWDSFVLTFIPTRAKPIKQLNVDPEFLFTSRNSGWQPKDSVIGY